MLGGGSTWGFWGAKREPKRLFFRGPRRCQLSAAAEAWCFPAGCERRLLGEGLRGLYYYLLSLRGGAWGGGDRKKKKKPPLLGTLPNRSGD